MEFEQDNLMGLTTRQIDEELQKVLTQLMKNEIDAATAKKKSIELNKCISAIQKELRQAKKSLKEKGQ